MNTSEYKRFLRFCSKNIDNSNLELFNVDDIVHSIFDQVEKLKGQAQRVREKFLNNIVDNLLLFEKNCLSNNLNINWCLSSEDFLENLLNLLGRKKIKSVNLSSSEFFEQLDLKNSLKSDKISTFSKDNRCFILEADLGIVDSASFFSVFESEFEMELFLDSKIKIIILPINKFICNISDIDIFTHIFSIYKNNKSFPSLTNIFTPKQIGNQEEVYVFVVDNEQSNLLSFKEQRKALLCIDCGACKRVCPVYQTIKDEPYNNSLTGPIANILLPFIENFDNHKHLTYNCLLCGNCTSICPVNISIPDLIIENRKYFFENKILDHNDNILILSLRKFFLRNKNKNLKPWLKRYLLRRIIPKITRKQLQIPQFAKKTFNKIQQDNNKG
ncbi:MAG: lactate utilization protein [Bacteroidales bacterium]|nr:lactate utilization protein [Bacteroidales bacterium]